MNTRLPRAFATQILVAALVVLGAGGGLGFSIVALRQDIAVSANNSRIMEQRITETERRLAELGGAIAAEQTPEILARRNQSLSLGLVPPVEARLVRVDTSVTQRLAAKRNAEIFAAENGATLVPVRFNLGGGAQR